jgi:carbon storage regulator CsrA
MNVLVLSRKINESIRIETSDGTVEVKVTKAEGKIVRLAIDAPRVVKVLRAEVAGRTKPGEG